MKNLKSFGIFLNESSEAGPNFVESFLTNKRYSFSDIYKFYGWVRETLPTRYTRDIISYDDAQSLLQKAEQKYTDYKFNVVGGDRRPEDCQVWCRVYKSEDRQVVYDILLGHATSMEDIDSMISDFEYNIKSLANSM